VIHRRPLLGSLLALPGIARAQGPWPDRPVRIVIPFGAGGSIGIRTVIQAPPDGATFLLTSASLASVPALYPSQGLDPRTAMTPVSLVADVPTAMVVRAAGPFLSVQEVVAAAKAAPGRYTFGSGGAGSSNHLSGALFASAAGVELTHISYRGAAPAMTALYAGEIDMVFASTVETLPHVRGGRARLLGVATPQRIAALPDTPAIAEIVPGYVALNWYAIAGPRGVPPAIVARFAETLGTLRDLPDVKARFAAAGTVPLLTGPRELAALLETDVPKWQRVVTDAGIRVE
jgi:tripartite-type tricarboxylate transporter receptor subunit TctC